MSLHQQIFRLKIKRNKMKHEILEAKKQIPSNIGKYIYGTYRVPYKTKTGKIAKRKLYDATDFNNNFKVIYTGSKFSQRGKKSSNLTKRNTKPYNNFNFPSE